MWLTLCLVPWCHLHQVFHKDGFEVLLVSPPLNIFDLILTCNDHDLMIPIERSLWYLSHLSIYMSIIHPSIHLCIHPFIYLIHPSIHLYIHPLFDTSIHPIHSFITFFWVLECSLLSDILSFENGLVLTFVLWSLKLFTILYQPTTSDIIKLYQVDLTNNDLSSCVPSINDPHKWKTLLTTIIKRRFM